MIDTYPMLWWRPTVRNDARLNQTPSRASGRDGLLPLLSRKSKRAWNTAVRQRWRSRTQEWWCSVLPAEPPGRRHRDQAERYTYSHFTIEKRPYKTVQVGQWEWRRLVSCCQSIYFCCHVLLLLNFRQPYVMCFLSLLLHNMGIQFGYSFSFNLFINSCLASILV